MAGFHAVVVTGAVDGGRSAVVLAVDQQPSAKCVVEEPAELVPRWLPVLAFRLDCLQAAASTAEMGARLGIGVPPAAALRQVANASACGLGVGAPNVTVPAEQKRCRA